MMKTFLAVILIALLAGCQPIDCCKECTDAFSQSPVAVGEEGAYCGQFISEKSMSESCNDRFARKLMTVADCGK